MTRRWIVFGLPALPLLAQGNGKGKGKGNGGGKGNANGPGGGGVAVSGAIIFGSGDRGIIESWIHRQQPSNLPPGLAKRGGALPPGLEKQLRRNGRLPPGLEKNGWTPFPADLERSLPPLPADYMRGFIGGRAAILRRGTQVVVDLFVPAG